MRRRDFIKVIGGGAVTWPLIAHAQQKTAIRARHPRVGILMSIAETNADAQVRVSGLRKGMLELGWVGEREAQLDFRWAAGDPNKMRELASELVKSKPDVLVGTNTPTLIALRDQGSKIPIVFLNISDPIGEGFIQSIRQPGGQMTGLISIEASLVGKWLQLLKEIAPSLRRAALLFNPITAPFAVNFIEPAREAAQAAGLELRDMRVQAASELVQEIASLAREGSAGVIVMAENFTTTNAKTIIAATRDNQLPAVYPFLFFVRGGWFA